ncbi:ABC transporter permease [Halopenitus persicus]|uniref:ABC transporter permease n=1 Tax=Halopenitus persicus TaxID=1048396 RepID=UPI000BBAC64B|nr:ABC transporter permease [Halopenitus persicus]
MSLLFEQLLNGLTIGVVYVLIAAGLSVIFGVMDVINFSHGELFALGAYFAISLAAPFGGPGFWLALVVAPLLVGIIGAAIERFTIRPLYGRNPLYQILLTFGLVLVIADVIVLIWGRQQQQFSGPPSLAGSIQIFGFSYSIYNLFIIVFGLALAGAIWYGLNNTRVGLVIRAGAQDREMVQNLGIEIDRYYTLVFGVGSAIAAAGGVVLGGYQSVSPAMGHSVIIPAFVIVVLGGLGSFRGAVAGGLLVGVIQTLTRSYVPLLEGLVVFLLMIAVLLVKPSGLFGDPEWQEAGEEHTTLSTGSGGILTKSQRLRVGAAVVGALLVIPLGTNVLYSPYIVSITSDILIWALFALSLDLVLGYAGLVSLGHAMFYGLGAYTTMLTMLHLTPSVPVALVIAIIVAGIIAWVVGYLSIRVSGIYFAMITLAFAQVFYNLVYKFEWTGSSQGLYGATPMYGIAGIGVAVGDLSLSVGPISISSAEVFYYLLVVIAVCSFLLVRRIMAAPFGSVLKSIRESQKRSRFVGYNVTAHKRNAFVLSGGLAGLAGGLYAISNGFVSPDVLHWLRSGELVVMAVLGGIGTLYGPMLGAGVFIFFEDLLSTYIEQWRMVLGTIFILFVIYVPRGIVSIGPYLRDRGIIDITEQRFERSEIDDD